MTITVCSTCRNVVESMERTDLLDGFTEMSYQQQWLRLIATTCCFAICSGLHKSSKHSAASAGSHRLSQPMPRHGLATGEPHSHRPLICPNAWDFCKKTARKCNTGHDYCRRFSLLRQTARRLPQHKATHICTGKSMLEQPATTVLTPLATQKEELMNPAGTSSNTQWGMPIPCG